MSMLPFLIAYIWLVAVVMVVSFVAAFGIARVTYQVILPLRARFQGTTFNAGSPERWFSYFIFSPFFAVLSPFGIAVGLRFLSGAGYWGAVAETLSDRHVAQYMVVLRG